LAVRLPRLLIDTETIRDNSDFANRGLHAIT